jgi:hypothetical protein
MFSSESNSYPKREKPFENWQELYNWARSHYRQRTFHKDQAIPIRPGLLYLVNKGAVRLLGFAPINEQPQVTETERHRRDFFGNSRNRTTF